MPGRLLLAAAGAVALVAAGLGTATAQAAAPAAAGTSAVTTRAVCGAPAKGHARCLALARTDAAAKAATQHMNSVRSAAPAAATAATAPNGGYGPADIRSAYNLGGTGSGGRTVAIVDAYDDPTAASDLAAYRSSFGLSACGSGCFTKVNQSGSTSLSSLPKTDAGWAEEISLDLDMVSATCPDCRILLVEANSSSLTDLGAAVNTAARQPGVVAISNSYGGSDLPDLLYGSPYNHPGIAVTASSGDGGYGAQFPADSKYVTAVGGTSLSRAQTSRGWTETAWSGAGSGCSRYNSALSAASAVGTGCSRRAEADVSAVADPATGVAVYDTTVPSTDTAGWLVFGGTSASSPIIASVYALSGNTSGTANALPYKLRTSTDLNDVTSGSNGSCTTQQLCTARTGWDGPTGLGTPNGTGAF